jgi:uncharacterized OsmC-like protein
MTAHLKDILDSRAEAMTLNPSAAMAQVTVGGELTGVCEVEITVGNRTIKSDMPQGLGGGTAPTPGQYALAALGACQAVTYRFWSEKLGIRLEKLRVDVTGDIDHRSLFGVDADTRPGFGKVAVNVTLSGPETPEQYEELRRHVDEHCPVLDLFANPVPVDTALTVA